MSERTGLDAIASDKGVFSIVAMDQRNTLKRMFAAVGVPEPTDAQMRGSKVAVARALTPHASAILFDPTWGVPAVMEAGALAPNCGLLVAAEPEVRGKFGVEPITHRDPALNAAWVKAQGGHAMKFLVQMRVDRINDPSGPDITQGVLDVVRELIADCEKEGIPSVVENLIYALPGEELTPEIRETAIIEAARALNDLQPSMLKLEYPGSPAGARRLADVCTVPWAVLSAGVAFDQFEEVLRISFADGGASGFIAGRSVWKEAIGMDDAEQAKFLEEIAVPRLQKLVDYAEANARPWQEVAR